MTEPISIDCSVFRQNLIKHIKSDKFVSTTKMIKGSSRTRYRLENYCAFEMDIELENIPDTCRFDILIYCNKTGGPRRDWMSNTVINEPIGYDYNVRLRLVDNVSRCRTEFSDFGRSDVDEELLTDKLSLLIKRMKSKIIKSREKRLAKEQVRQKKASQKEAFEYMIRELGLQNKLTCSSTGRVVKVQVNSDIEKMKKIFGILADIPYDEVEQMYALAQIQ